MDKYRLYELDENTFETLVNRLCMQVLGFASFRFSRGKDGGRDAVFNGKANKFPSEQDCLEGNCCIQAKHTGNSSLSCSDNSFEILVKNEIPKIQKLVDENGLEHYLLFTNRRCPAGAKDKFESLIFDNVKNLKSAYLIGNQGIEDYLAEYPQLIEEFQLGIYRPPFKIDSDDLKNIIVAFHSSKEEILESINTAKNYRLYKGIELKNQKNSLGEGYFDYIKNNSQQYFNDIDNFLENPRNRKYKDFYHDVSDELKGKLIINKYKFTSFEQAFGFIYDYTVEKHNDIRPRQLINVFLHYMYCNCDIGEDVNSN